MDYDFEYFAGRDLKAPDRASRPKMPESGAPASFFREYADKLETYEELSAQRKILMEEYRAALQKREKEFQDKLRDDYGLTQGQFDVLYQYAYAEGHSEGLRRIAEIFEEIYDVAEAFRRKSDL